MSSLSLRATWSWRVVWGCYLALIALYMGNTLVWVGPEREPSLVICLLYVGPLLMVAPGLVHKNLRAPIWLCFLLLLYFMLVVTRLFTPGNGLLESLETALVVILFIAAMMSVRWRARYLRELEDGEQSNG